MSFIVNVMLNAKYITPKNQIKLQPCSCTLNIRYTTTDVDNTPAVSHGLNLPKRLRVRSIMLPMIGSFSASKIRAAIMIAVTAPSCAAVSECVNSTYVSR